MVIERVDPKELDKFRELRQIFIEVFEENVPELDEKQYAVIRDNRNLVVFGATVGFELVGGLTAHIIPNYYRGGLDLYIQDLGIKKEHRRKGIAGQLIHKCKEFCAAHNIKEMYLAAEADDKQANDFYKTTEAEELPAIFYNYKIQ